ncbi:hypothetical protein DL546_000613 [Coniochaeta pulveracea]|uniref:UBZ4-type domain-containing protein n=1 Tax=Coniochaeta pulveracea TaxID=177199 RepID=A0A420XWI1_9PEZI|nr:hypothetical protein DL546_000613 [Coniochaeta pulveracea]
MHRPYKPVPSIQEVIPGASVNIVLKQDQPTGRTVSGTVRDILTRGNHPRGIKVRLADGRNGFEVKGNVTDEARGGRRRFGRGARDIRRDEAEEVPPTAIGLDAYIKPARQRGRGKGKVRGATEGTVASDEQSSTADDAIRGQGELALCPVCQDFQGDEAAVAHHVATHFDA